MREIETHACQAYNHEFGAQPEIMASAPGRVNLIGEHTDYNGGFVLPCAIDRRVAVGMGRNGDVIYSVEHKERVSVATSRSGSWRDYPSGVAWALRDGGHGVGQFRGAFVGAVPQGAGLSSSAAIECATAVGLDALFDLHIGRKELAVVAQRAENQFVGVNSGIMDQYASLLCRHGAALLIDCRTLEAESVPLDLQAMGLSLVVCDTRVARTLAATGYNERRATCERAAKELGVSQLRDATLGDLERLDDMALRRVRHVVTENQRVLDAVAALRDGDLQRFGLLMYESHASLRDDFEVSVPQLDAFVAVAARAGALGARLTGAGFGGCAVALITSSAVKELESIVDAEFALKGFTKPIYYSFLPADGAEIVS